jgi:hypothetical protein
MRKRPQRPRRKINIGVIILLLGILGVVGFIAYDHFTDVGQAE